jgi:hypothetical protein
VPWPLCRKVVIWKDELHADILNTKYPSIWEVLMVYRFFPRRIHLCQTEEERKFENLCEQFKVDSLYATTVIPPASLCALRLLPKILPSGYQTVFLRNLH